MNLGIITGNVVADADYRTVKIDGVDTPRCKFSVAVNEKKNKNEKIVTFFDVALWRDYAIKTAPWIKKGRKVLVYGPVRKNTYKTQNGEEKTEIQIVNGTVELLDRKPEENTPEPRVMIPTVVIPEDLPF